MPLEVTVNEIERAADGGSGSEGMSALIAKMVKADRSFPAEADESVLATACQMFVKRDEAAMFKALGVSISAKRLAHLTEEAVGRCRGASQDGKGSRMTEEIEENADASDQSAMSFAAAETRRALIEEMGDSGFARPAGMQNSAHAVLKDIQPMRENVPAPRGVREPRQGPDGRPESPRRA